jgi:SAM-dependent methyltransferase
MPNAHDLVRYPDLCFPQTHPVALGAFAALFGKAHTPFAASRVLEIGCGGGVNLISMALGAPASEFVGVDLAGQPIALARAAAEASGLRNVSLYVQDIRDMDAALGRFDYIIAHGVYAWVPADVSRVLMRIVGELLSADGLALISYAAHPGGRLHQAVRDRLLAAADGAVDPRERLALARAALADQIASWSEADALQRAMIVVARHIIEQPPEVLFHDEMTAFYEPKLLSDVVAAAGEVGLDYLCDAQPRFSAEAFFPSEKYAAARVSAAGDWGRFEQLVDFTEMRSFRSSIFCRGGDIDRRLEARRLRGLWACGDLRAAEPDPEEPGSFAFRANGAKIATNNPTLAQFLASLAAAFPSSIALDAAAQEPGLAEYVLTLFVANVIRVTSAPLPFALASGERPIASPLARFQAARGERTVATLLHYPHTFEDSSALDFVVALDGTRTRDELAREIAARTGAADGAARAQVSQTLTEFTRLGLMLG